MTYTEATEAIKRLPLVPMRPAGFPQPPNPSVKQAAAFVNCKQNRRGKWSCRAAS